MARPLEDIQDELLDRVHAGELIDREEVIEAHSEHTDALRRFFALLDEIEPAPEVVEPLTMRLGEFRIIREVGRGGMGIVHEAEQTSLKRHVALKVLPAVLATNQRIIARFRREAEAAGRLRHPNIVPVYAVGDAGGLPFFAMELVDGRALADVLAERAAGDDAGLPAAGAPWRRWVLKTVVSIAEALDYAHGQGILHRDVKPGNILLEEDGTPRLTDFGLALDLDAPGLTRSGETFGTPLYMSPEQAVRREAPLDRRTDVYSLGVTLFEMLTLRSPYAGTTTVEILAALQTGKIVRPRDVDPEIPRALESVLLRALECDPARRYESAAAFAADLRGVLKGRRVPKTAVPATRSRRPLLLAGAAALVAAAAWAATTLFPGSPDPQAAPDSQAARAAAGAWAHIVAGEPGHDALLAESIRPRVRMREVVSRADPGAVTFELAFSGGEASYAARAVLYCLWEAQVDGGEWRTVRWDMDGSGPSGEGHSTMGIRLAELLGDALENGSAGLGLRLSARVVAYPEGEQIFAGGATHASRPDDWVETGGSVFEWKTYRSVLIYDDFPADYPTVIHDPGIDAAMRGSLTPGAVGSLSIGGSRELSVDFQDIPALGPLPAACEIDLCREGSDEVIGTARWTRRAAPEGTDEPTGGIDYSANISFRLREPPPPGEQRFVLDVASNRIARVRLIFRPSRQVALEDTDFDRYWGGTIDVPLAVHSFAPSGAGVSEPGDRPGEGQRGSAVAAPPGAPWPDPTTLTTSDFEALVAGTHPDGESVLRSWVHARIRMPSTLSRDDLTKWFTPLQVMHGRIVPGAGEAGGATLRADWEMAADDDPWQALGWSKCLMFGGDPFVLFDNETVTRALGEAAVRDELDLHFRVRVWLVRGPEERSGQPTPGAVEWEAIADQGTQCTVEFSRMLRICERYPDDYPRALDDAATQAAVERWLDPDYVELSGSSLSRGTLDDFDLTLKVVGEVPVPIAAEVAVFDPVTDRRIGRARPLVVGSDERRNWPWNLFLDVELNDPASEDDVQLARDLRSGKKSGLRLRFRGSREAALGTGKFVSDSFWAGEIDLIVPFKSD